ncbi:unnamed protein product [Mucor fragilis]
MTATGRPMRSCLWKNANPPSKNSAAIDWYVMRAIFSSRLHCIVSSSRSTAVSWSKSESLRNRNSVTNKTHEKACVALHGRELTSIAGIFQRILLVLIVKTQAWDVSL